jgi:hypothetical protein
MNEVNDELEDELNTVLGRTLDSFGLTLSSNKLGEEVTEHLHERIRKLHGLNVELQVQQAEQDGASVEGIVVDSMIHQRRCAI